MNLIYILLGLEALAIAFFLYRWLVERRINHQTSFVINHFTNLLAKNKGIEELMWDVTQQCLPILKLEDCVIYLKQSNGSFMQVAAYGPKAKSGKVDGPIFLKPGQGIVGLAIQTAQIQNISNTSRHPSYIPDDEIRLSELSVPIILGGEVVGVIDSEHPSPRYYKKYHERILSIIAMLCASKIEEVNTTERAEEKEKFEEKYNYLRQLDLMKTDFVKSIAHDLKSPLTLMSIRLEELAQHGLDPAARNTLEALNQNFTVFEGVLNQMMELNEIESGNTTIRPKSLEPSEVLKKWCALYEGQYAKANVDLKLEFDDLPNRWTTDESKWQRIFMNLISNAIKFTPEGGEVKVSAHQEDEYLYVSVFNSGDPIEDQHLPHLFEKFYQGKEENIGSGLGLHICRSLIELLGGDIWVTTYSSGNSFEFRIPSLEQEIESVVENPTLHLSSDIPIVVVIEDHADLRQTLADALSSEYQVLTAPEGRKGLKLCHRWQPELVISDLRMPGMDGLEFVSELRKDPRTDHIPVIITSARGTFDDRLELMGNGVDLFFSKPYVMAELKAAMKQLISRNKQDDKNEMGLDAPSRAFLEDLHSFLDDHLSNPDLNNSHLEEHFSLGRNALLRKTRSIVGCSPAEYTLKYRLQRARDLLKIANQSVKEVAFHCGFNHPSYFTKAFKKEFGYPPSEVDKAYTGE